MTPAEVDAIRITTLNEDRSEVTAALTELSPAFDAQVTVDGTLDADITDSEVSDAGAIDAGPPPPPAEGDPIKLTSTLKPGRGLGWVVVQGLHDGLEVVRAEARGGDGASVTIPLDRACLGLRCPLGRACVRGACELAQEGGQPCGGDQ